MSATQSVEVGPRIIDLRRLEKAHSRLVSTLKMLGALMGLGWALVIYKVSQTPDHLLANSPEVHEALGTWVINLLGMFVIFLVVLFWARRKKARINSTSKALVGDLRTQLTTADVAERVQMESHLRELGA